MLELQGQERLDKVTITAFAPPLKSKEQPGVSCMCISKMLRYALCVVFILTVTNLYADQSVSDSGKNSDDVEYRWGIKIPTSDGTLLSATLYKGKSSDGKQLSTIVTITPYISDRYHSDALYFARHGFAFLVVDTRGRGNSGGTFNPLNLEDGKDGKDVVEWIAKQKWSNGKVGMRGGSYGGYNQWVTARYFPPHLKTIAPIASPYHGVDFPMEQGVQRPFTIRWLTLTGGRTAQNQSFGDNDFWNRKFLSYHREGIKYLDLDDFVGNPIKIFDEWARRPLIDDEWRALVPSSQELSRLNLPILSITGYYDGDQPGALEHFKSHMKYGSEEGKSKHYLLLGPWDHAGTRSPKQKVGGFEFGDKMVFNALELDRDWYKFAFGEHQRPSFLKDRVTYFVSGANIWRGAASLDAISNETLTYSLNSKNERHDAFNTGHLTKNSVNDGSKSSFYLYDPLDIKKAEQEQNNNFLIDQSEVMQTNGNGIIFHSSPFVEETEISGFPRLEGWFELNVPDTDIKATLYEVFPDGESILLSSHTLRVRHRDGAESERMMEPGVPEKLVFEHFDFFSRSINRGSRLRLFLRPANALGDQRNFNSDKPVYLQTRSDARTAIVRLYHSKKYPSYLHLPVVSNKKQGKGKE